jgi:hypothetical protein
MNRKILSIVLCCLVCSVFCQQKESTCKQANKENVKILFVVDGVQKMWTKKQQKDSINWSRLKVFNSITDSVKLKKYGEKGKNGVFIVKYR